MSESVHRPQQLPERSSHQRRPSKQRRKKWQKLTPLERLMFDEHTPSKQDIISVCFTLSSILTVQDLQRTVLPRFLSHPRFCSTLSKRWGSFIFQPDALFTATSPQITSYHITVEPVVSASLSEQEKLRAFTSSLNHIMSTTLDSTRPLWKLFMFPQWSLSPETRANSTTLVLRVHHSISDGIGLVKYFLSRVIDSDTPAAKLSLSRPKRPHRSIIRVCADTMGDLKKSAFVLFRADQKTPFTQPMQNNVNHCALLAPRPGIISELKLAAKKRNATINDILMASFAGSVRAYLADLGYNVDTLRRFHTAMPFNRHLFDEFRDEDVSNQLAILPVLLPIYLEDAEERFKACVREMNRVKRSLQPQLALAGMSVMTALPLTMRRVVWRHLSKSASVLFSNIPGPVSKVSVDGAEVQSVYVFPPIDSNTTVNIAMFSYDNGLFVAVSGDANRLTYPQSMIDHFSAELHMYLK
ncbi:unnamed protein product [Agarophyton chilense]